MRIVCTGIGQLHVLAIQTYLLQLWVRYSSVMCGISSLHFAVLSQVSAWSLNGIALGSGTIFAIHLCKLFNMNSIY